VAAKARRTQSVCRNFGVVAFIPRLERGLAWEARSALPLGSLTILERANRMAAWPA
jgi:hypothetical protein